LVADDNAVNRQLALVLLERMGYRPDVAADGVEVLEALERRPYDVVLMDVEMPDLDGVETTRRIHTRWSAEDCPRIIAVTANAMDGDRERYLAAGMDDYVSKPIRKEALAAALARSRPRPSPNARSSSPRGEAEHGPVDLTELESTVGDPGLVEELIATFLDGSPELVATLRNSLVQGNAEELRRAAHTLKSNAQTFGAAALTALCRELEATAKKAALEHAPDLVTRIESEYLRVANALTVRGASAQA
jgi:CheY-like chemotaxis protein/HPt (histidine-containing phosphotransfer) domain-containing protein